MYHFYDVVINDKTGVPLNGVIVRIYNDAGAIVPLWSDEAGVTPIESVSGIPNAAVTDDAGNYDFYVADGTYDIRFFVGDATLKVLPNILMGFPDLTGIQAEIDNRPTNPQLDIATSQTSASIQSVVNSASDNGQRVDLLKRDFPLDAALISGSKAIEYQGAGAEATRLLVDGPRSAIEHGLTSQVYYASLAVRDLAICATNAAVGSSQTAINAKFDKSSGGFLLENVVFRPFSDGYDFAQYVQATGATRTTFKNVRALGSTFDADSATDVQIAFRFTSNDNADKSYEYVFDDVTVQAEISGFLFEVLGAPGNSGSLEGITMTNVRGRTNFGPLIDFKVTNGGWKPPFFSIGAGFNYQGTGAIAHFDGIESITIAGGGWHFFDAALPTSPTLNQIQLRNARKVVIKDQTFRINDLAKLQWVISVEGGCSDVLIENCTFIYTGAPTACSGGIFIDASLPNVMARNCVFVNWPSNLPKAQYSDGRTIPVEDTTRRLNSLPQFGAVGDNVADDRAAFASANGFGGLNFIPKPPSKYKLSSAFASSSAAWLPDPSMTWDQLTDGGRFDMTRGFFGGSGNIWRLADRVFIGHAAGHFAGSGSLPDAGDAWLKTSTDGPSYLAANAQLLVMTTEKRYAGVFAAKTGLSGGAGEAIGFGSVLINNGSGNGWGGIVEAQHTSTTTTTWGMEFAIKHASGVNVISTPYSAPVGATRGIMLVGSGDNSFGPAATNPSTVGITFTTNHALGWNTGIEFRGGSIPTGEAISLGNGMGFNWYETSGGQSASIKSVNNTAGAKLTLQFQSGGLNLLNNAGNSVLFVSAAASDVNRVQFTSGGAGVPPQIDAAGSDTNIDLRLNAKGTGRVRFGTFTTNADAPVIGCIEVKDLSGNIRKLAVIA